MKDSKIEWTHSTFNPWWGCEKVSPGCTHCYAEAFAKRVGQKVWGGDSPRRFFGDKHWAEPLKWNREAAKSGQPWRVFCASMADVFEDRRDLDAQRERLWALIEATPALTWLLLTKRPENVCRLMPPRWGGAAEDWTLLEAIPRNVWVGATTEDQARLDKRLPALLNVPAAVRFLSVEPMLEHIDLSLDLHRGNRPEWAIFGGESGAGSRPLDVAWIRSAVKQCRADGVAVHVKQLGAKPIDHGAGETATHFEERECWPASVCRRTPVYDTAIRLADAKGGDWTEWPEDLRVREYPGGAA